MGKDYYIFSNGRIKRHENTFQFIDAEDNKKSLPIEQTERLHLYGEVDLNTKLLNYAAQYGVMINYYNYYGFYSGTIYPRKKNVSGLLLVKQSENYINSEKRMYLAKCFVDSAAFHILRQLRRHKDKTSEYIEQIEGELSNVYRAENINELMGAEGRIRKIYYKTFPLILKKRF